MNNDTHDLICWLLIIWIPINKKRFFSLLENEIINTKISFYLQLLFFCFSKILALQWGSFELLVKWQMTMETRPWLPHIYTHTHTHIYIYIYYLKNKKIKKNSLFLPLLSALFSHSSINIMSLKKILFLFEIYNSSSLLGGVSMNSFIWITIL